MKSVLVKIYYEKNSQLKDWGQQNLIGLFIFNITLVVLLLLRSNGYFLPFFPITMNMVIFLAIVLAVGLLGIRSKACFLLALLFWIFAAFLKIMKIDIWAERTAVYVFECLIVGILLLIFETKTKSDSIIHED